MANELTRRAFVKAAAAGSSALAWLGARRAPRVLAAEADKPALLGGTPVHRGGWPGWPQWREAWEPQILQVLRSGRWCRSGGGGQVPEFEAGWAGLLGAKRCVATASGTTALITALHVMGVDAGDEVITSPYTFIATYNTILMHKALPVFADTDPATLTLDPASIESRITERTRAIVPVHIYGLPCDMDPINAVAQRHKLAVVEDACQAWLAEFRGQKCGTLGNLGCFSFQNSKHLTCGEGGAVVGADDAVMDRAYSYHNFGSGGPHLGSKCRMTEFQAAILLAQMERLEEQTQRRWENARYLTSQLQGIPGIHPHRLYDGVTRAAYHLYPLRFKADEFQGVTRDKFIAALRAEGIPCSGGYGRLNKAPFIENTLNSRNFQRMYSREELDHCRAQIECPENDQLCNEAVCFSQQLLLGSKEDIDDIANAIGKIYENREQLA